MPLLALDDRDADIVYSTGWGQAGSANEFNSTTTFTREAGATAEVTFFGTSISVFGTLAGSLRQRPVSSYSIDGGTAVTFTGNPSSTAQFNQLFFRSPALPLGNHTLLITNTGEDAPLFLDLMLVTPPDGPITTTTTVTTTFTQPAVTSAAQTVTVTAGSTAAPSGDSAGSSSGDATGASQGSSNAGAIAGGIVGALALIALLVLGAIFYRRRQRKMRENANSNAFWNSTTGVQPLPSPSFAPQFQTTPGQLPMVQTNSTGAGSFSGYTPEQWSSPYSNNPPPPGPSYPAPVAQAQPSYTPQPQNTYLPPSAQMSNFQQGGGRPPSSDLAYYSTNDAYEGYADPGPYPPPQTTGPSGAGSAGVGANGRVRVNLDG